MTEEEIANQKAKIAEYAKVIDDAAQSPEHEELLSYVVDEVYDRALLYLNRTHVPAVCNRVLARVVASVFNATYNTKGSTEAEQAVSGLTDNGQSVSYSNEVKQYLVSTDDEELFRGASKLLELHRRPNVVS